MDEWMDGGWMNITINQSINQSIDRSIDQSINQSINQSIDTINLFYHLRTYPEERVFDLKWLNRRRI